MSRRRLSFFIIGTLLGCVFVYAVLIRGNKFPAWLPNDRIMQQVKETPMELSPRAQCMLACYGMKVEDISAVIDNGEAIISESQPRREPRPIYAIDGKTLAGIEVRIYTETNTYRNMTTILSIDKKVSAATEKCNCPELKMN